MRFLFAKMKHKFSGIGKTLYVTLFSQNLSLVQWVDNQKTQHKKMYEGKPTHLTIERIQVLVGLGFQWR